MGADGAPAVEVAGVVHAVREADVDIVLVGDESRVAPLLATSDFDRQRITIHHAPEVVTMNDAPSVAVRQKKQSSMRICFDLMKAKDVDAVVSAGNTGAMLACGLLVLGRLPGVERPGIVTTFPTKKGPCALLDMGANVDIKAQVLAQFAVMGSVYARLRNRRSRPRVGLLSNGSEEHKGTLLTREAHALLSRPALTTDFEYVGYVEGRDIFSGDIDVVVTDGFTGNVVLKSLEGLVDAVFHLLRVEVQRSGPLSKLGALLMKPALRRFRQHTDPDETGGAPLLGVEGVAMICHGGSDARAIKNAILVAREFADLKLSTALSDAVAAHTYLWADAPLAPPGGVS